MSLLTPLEQSVLNMVKLVGIHPLRQDYKHRIVSAAYRGDTDVITEYNAKMAILNEISDRYEIVPVTSNGFMCEPCGASGFQLYERVKKS
jgi:hypothetical protein